MRKLRQLWSSPLEEASTRRLARILAAGDPARRVRALRELAGRGQVELGRWGALCEDPHPALRRAALRLAPLDVVRACVDRTWTGRVVRAQALARWGVHQPPSPLMVWTSDGQQRCPERALGLGLGDAAVDLDMVREDRAALWARAPQDRAALEALGAHGVAEDVPRLLALGQGLGKRGQNAWLLALGRSGDPRVMPWLVRALRREAVDPARGFALRRIAALGLGRLGLGGEELVRAFHAERAHEGTPGAGLGVQYPVRAVLLWALGECQHEAAAPLMVRCLDDRTGNALGGLHLFALGALQKLGPAARPYLDGVEGAAARELAALRELD